jgi:cellulose biosynthesis protein BcsQ
MQTIALSCNKGGVGKTTIAKHLATAAAAAGLNVMILDMDTQQNARTGVVAGASKRVARSCPWFSSSRKTIYRTQSHARARQATT